MYHQWRFVMSSSDKLPDWSLFSKRQVLIDVDLLSPASEIVSLLQKYSCEMEKAKQETESVRREWLNVVAQQAVFAVQLESALKRYEPLLAQASLGRIYKHIRIIKDQMLDDIKNAGLEVSIPIGKTFNEVSDNVSVDGWVHNEKFTSEVVADVIEPIVFVNGKLLRAGRVVMGAPPEKTGALQSAINNE
jgi:hypothetical protein